jgi:hypothetical protein
LISTVRIGAGAWRLTATTKESGDTDQAGRERDGARTETQERKEPREEALKKRTRDGAEAEEPAPVVNRNPALARATPRHSVALRANRVN